jgi:hypothetical protein
MCPSKKYAKIISQYGERIKTLLTYICMHPNVVNRSGWAFFDKDIKDMTVSEKVENNWIVSYIEERANWRFPPGFAPSIPSARLTFDPVFATQRPFFFYFAIAVVNNIGHVILRSVGYIRRREYDVVSQAIYFRPARKLNPNKQALPIVFIHGIGIGFPHYLGLILSLPDESDIYLVEWPHVAMQFTSSVPTIDHTVRYLTTVSLLTTHLYCLRRLILLLEF